MALPRVSLRNQGKLWQARLYHARYRRWPRPLAPYTGMPFATHDYGHPPGNHTAIPRIIWTYWTGPQPPRLVRQCFANWARVNPGHDIHIVDDAQLAALLGEVPSDLARHGPAKRSDWVRLALLERYGGIWIDASTILTQSLDWVQHQHRQSDSDYVGFYIEQFTRDMRFPIVESWLMAAPPGSPFIRAALHEFTSQVLPRSGEGYVQYLRDLGLYDQLSQAIYGTDYLSIHLSMQRVLRSGSVPCRLRLARAEDGPFLYQASNRWNRHHFRAQLTTTLLQGEVAPLVKLRNSDRRGLVMCTEAGLCTPGSLIDTYLLCEKVRK